ncbi:hypothetical protein [Pyxidicoccus trucidator]|uniref:hypothetical protein n=1 Tax=Pyxidicoccus trucidator TaxID=2709662 RepID=UPI0013DAB1E7|nr:hypothetical protein [Pyxidicoccus trucidator]
MRAGMVGGLLLVGLMAGCGGAAVEEEGSSELESRSDALPSCRDVTGNDYVITYYKEPARLTWVGELLCGCSEPETVVHGSKSQYYEKIYGCFAR